MSPVSDKSCFSKNSISNPNDSLYQEKQFNYGKIDMSQIKIISENFKTLNIDSLFNSGLTSKREDAFSQDNIIDKNKKF